ncbi:helix-turn-helix domain-containing protein [Actinokineospora sp. 24-640]
MPKSRPKPQARGLAAGLRAARKATGLTTTAIAEKLGWSQSVVSRTETGKRHTSPEEVATFLAVCGVTGEDRKRLIAMAHDRDRSNWLETRYSEAVPIQATTLAQYESEATGITDAALVLMPGLLQTPGYIRAMMNSGGVAAHQIEPRVSLRLERQELLDRPVPPTITAIIDEAVLHRRIGGKRVMVEQLRHLVEMAERPQVNLHVIPFDHGGHAGVNGAFALIKFKQGGPVVHLEHLRSGLFLDEPSDVIPYADAVARMTAIALDQAQSADLIVDMAARYERE